MSPADNWWVLLHGTPLTPAVWDGLLRTSVPEGMFCARRPPSPAACRGPA